MLIDLSKHQMTIVGKFTFATILIDSVPYDGVVAIKYVLASAFGTGSAFLKLYVIKDEFLTSSVRAAGLIRESEKLLRSRNTHE